MQLRLQFSFIFSASLLEFSEFLLSILCPAAGFPNTRSFIEHLLCAGHCGPFLCTYHHSHLISEEMSHKRTGTELEPNSKCLTIQLFLFVLSDKNINKNFNYYFCPGGQSPILTNSLCAYSFNLCLGAQPVGNI